jgi:hypothetical protein
MKTITLFDYVFVLSAVLFNLLIAGIFIAQKMKRSKLVRALGFTWLLLVLPLAIVFINYIQTGREPWIIYCFGLIFLYMLVEFLLDYVFKYDFRKKWITHIPYIILEYIALFSLIFISVDIHPTWGWVVSVCFWILLASLIYLLKGRKKEEASE